MFVTGTGTEVGKTVVAAAIARAAAADGRSVTAFKPAVSGLDELGGVEPDHELLRRASGSVQTDDEIAPYRYGPAVSRTWARSSPARRSTPPGCGAWPAWPPPPATTSSPRASAASWSRSRRAT